MNVSRLFKRHGWSWMVNETATFRNPELRIAGRPHGIDPADGGMVPIVVVGWNWLQILGEDDLRQINTMDRWSLAFYWLLLQPLRARAGMEPTGWAVRDRDIKFIRWRTNWRMSGPPSSRPDGRRWLSRLGRVADARWRRWVPDEILRGNAPLAWRYRRAG